MAFTRNAWNAIIQQVNELATNPPAGCNPLATLELVGPKHKWSKGDIGAVQAKLMAICNTNTFAAVPEKWRQSTIDEINAAIARGWCNCNDEDYDMILSQLQPVVSSNCYGDPVDGTMPLSEAINGLSVAEAGFSGRTWQLLQDTGGEPQSVASGAIDCWGKIIYTGSVRIAIRYGVYVYCANCEEPACQEALDNAQDVVDGMGVLTYTLHRVWSA